MPDFNIRIAVDPTSAPAAISAVHKPLVDLETMGPRVSEALSRGLSSGAGSADRLRESSSGAAEGIRKMADSGSALEGSFSQALLGRFGELGNVFSALTSGAAIETAALVGLGAELVHLGDEYTELRNSALRLSESLDTVDATISQQLAISKDLHGSLSQTMELSTIVKERTDELGYSFVQQTTLTEQWAEVIQLSGHSMADAAPAFDRLSFAIENGQGGAREMRTILRDYPLLAKELEQHFGVDTPAALMKLAQDGKIHVADLQATLAEFADSNHDKFSKLSETVGEQLTHAMDGLKTSLGKLVADSGLVEGLGIAFDHLSKFIEASLVPLEKLNDALGGKKGEAIKLLTASLSDLFGDDEKKSAFTMQQLTDEFTSSASKMANSAWADSFHESITRSTADTRSLGDAFGLYLTPKIDNTATAMINLDQIIRRDVASYDALARAARTFADEAANNVASPGAAGLTGVQYGQANSAAASELSARQKFDAAGDAAQEAVEKERLAIINEYASSIDKYRDALQRLDTDRSKGIIDDERWSEDLKTLRTRYNDMQSPAEKLADQVKLASEYLHDGVYNVDEYTKKLKTLGDAYDAALAKDDHSFGAGIEAAFKRLGDESRNTAKDVEEAFNNAFGSINKNVVAMIVGEQTDWAGMIKSVEQDLLTLTLKQAEGALVNSIMPSVGGGAALAAAVATGGTTAGATIAAAMIAAGSTAGAIIATEMAAGSATSTAFAASATALGGGATGGDFEIPHAANGFAGVVPQRSGADSMLAMFHVNPGEHVAIRTPDQQAAMNRPAAVQPTPVKIVNHIDKAVTLEHLDSPDGERVIMNMIRRNAGAVRSYTGGR